MWVRVFVFHVYVYLTDLCSFVVIVWTMICVSNVSHWASTMRHMFLLS